MQYIEHVMITPKPPAQGEKRRRCFEDPREALRKRRYLLVQAQHKG